MPNKFRGYQLIFLSCLVTLTTGISSAQEISNLQTSNDNPKTHTALFGNKSGGPISKKELLNSIESGLIAPYDSLFQIASFRLTRVRTGENPVELNNENNGKLTDEMKELLSNALIGDKIYFEYIKLKHQDGTKRSIGALSFVIE